MATPPPEQEFYRAVDTSRYQGGWLAIMVATILLVAAAGLIWFVWRLLLR